MPITADCHLHSSFSGDSDAPMEAMIRQGITLGLRHMCFTEHNDFDFPEAEGYAPGFWELNPDAYLHDFLKYKEKYAGKLSLSFGAELGLQPGCAAKNEAFVKAHAYDFIIGSSHLCHGIDVYYPSFFEGRAQEAAYLEYFESILENLDAYSDFDVYGHLDYVVRYGPKKDEGYSYEGFRDVFEQILTKLVSMGKGIELNTAGLAKGMREPNPCMGVIRRYRELGGEVVTVGSDAHSPAQVARSFDRAAGFLRDCGFRHYAVFSGRKPVFYPLS